MWLLLSLLLFLPVGLIVACVPGHLVDSNVDGGGGDDGGTGGDDGGDSLPCGIDCSKLVTEPCTVAVCNTGQVIGPVNTCVVVPAPDGTSCDDGLFCTTADSCMSGQCVGGPQNDCGMPTIPCQDIICYEDTKSCSVTPAAEMSACTPLDLCQVNGMCMVGECVGVPKDCTFSPLNECNDVSCDETTGMCTGTPDSNKDGDPCLLSGDPCNLGKECLAGQCTGGTPKDCSALNSGCEVGSCDETSGICGQVPAPTDTPCTDGVPDCYVGACDVKGNCVPTEGPNGNACNDHNACTKADSCTGGVCSGTPIAGCVLYFTEGFETCPDNWTFGGDWQCGMPSNPGGPPSAHTGKGCISVGLTADYHNDDSFSTCVATSPVIDLTTATNPELSYWEWDDTEGGTFDGWNIKVSTDGGHTFTDLPTTSVSPPYPLMIANQPSYGGLLSAEGWQNYTADLTAYAGKSIILQIGFDSDAATVYPGVYIDDIVVAEPPQIPLYITSTSPLPNAYAGVPYSVTLAKTGGTSSSTWSILPGGTNNSWLTINAAPGAATATLSGTPTQADTGPVSVIVQVEEPSWNANAVQQTFTFEVEPDIYFTSFEGTCPDGWTLAGDWQCGVPTNPAGPGSAYDGMNCLSTGLTMDYSNLDKWAVTTATSPEINLSGLTTATLTFRMWIDTEGSTYDGANLQISTDGGMTWQVVNTITMTPYTLAIAGEPAWGGHLSALGWQLVQADLTNFAGTFVYLRFGFQSDASDTYAGVYIDDFLVE